MLIRKKFIMTKKVRKDVIKAANDVDWVNRTMRVDEMDSEMHQEDLMCAVLQDHAESVEEFLYDYEIDDWKEVLDGASKYCVEYDNESLPGLAEAMIENAKEDLDNQIDDLQNGLDEDQSKKLDRILQRVTYGVPNLALSIDDDFINDNIFCLFDKENHWYLVARN